MEWHQLPKISSWDIIICPSAPPYLSYLSCHKCLDNLTYLSVSSAAPGPHPQPSAAIRMTMSGPVWPLTCPTPSAMPSDQEDPPQVEPNHEDILPLKHFPHYWPFVRGILVGLWGESWWIPLTKSLWCGVFFVVSQNNLLNKQSNFWWFDVQPLSKPVLTSLDHLKWYSAKFFKQLENFIQHNVLKIYCVQVWILLNWGNINI